MQNPLLGLIVGLAVLGFLIYKKVSLGITLVVSSLVLAVLSMNIIEIADLLVRTTIDEITITLVFVTMEIMILTQLYNETGLIKKLVSSVNSLIRSPRLVLGLLPAIIGLLPVFGGALISAPIIDEQGKQMNLRDDLKAYVNFWFRHVIFPIYPLSDSVILIIMLTGISFFSLIYRQLPIVLIMVVMGCLLGLRKGIVRYERKEVMEPDKDHALLSFLVSFSPIILAVFLVIATGLNIAIAVLFGIVLLLIIAKPPLSVIKKVISNKSNYLMSLAAYGAMLLKNTMLSSGASQIVSNIVSGAVAPSLTLSILVPIFMSFITGSCGGGIAISVPILTSMIEMSSRTIGLLYTSAYIGYLGSPAHLCLVVTAEYFNIPLSKIYRYLAPSTVIMLIIALIVYFLF